MVKPMPLNMPLFHLALAALIVGCGDKDASGDDTHASGDDTSASGDDTSASGDDTSASGDCYALRFDGATQHVDTNVSWPATQVDNFTIEAWVLPESGEGYHTIASDLYRREDLGGMGAELAIVNGEVEFLIGMQRDFWETLRTEASVPIGQWVHVAASYQVDPPTRDVSMRIWVDGVQAAAVDFNILEWFYYTGEDVFIGARPELGTETLFPFAGKIRGVHIQSGVAHGDSSFSPDRDLAPTSDTLALWVFDAGSGSTVPNQASGAPAADLINSPTWELGCP